ncbi:hypothetical protein HGA91_00630 [candidate division WWE3 bacterium]|nr:hypothetical protein [candidate division WWE3 bacterium]
MDQTTRKLTGFEAIFMVVLQALMAAAFNINLALIADQITGKTPGIFMAIFMMGFFIVPAFLLIAALLPRGWDGMLILFATSVVGVFTLRFSAYAHLNVNPNAVEAVTKSLTLLFAWAFIVYICLRGFSFLRNRIVRFPPRWYDPIVLIVGLIAVYSTLW